MSAARQFVSCRVAHTDPDAPKHIGITFELANEASASSPRKSCP